MNFAEYLVSKKIDEVLFQEKENALWVTWRDEFDTMHPNSFTAQKLYLINPIRRKYPLKIEVVNPEGSISNPIPEESKPAMAKPSMPKPAICKPVVPVPKSESVSEKNTSSSESEPPKEQSTAKPVMAKPAIPRPVMKPKPKTDS